MNESRPRLFYTDASRITEGTARLQREESAHLARVLRMQPGDRVRLATERGEEFLAELTKISWRETEARIIKKLPARPAPPVDIALGLPLIKGERFEWVLEKGTELGVSRFFPLHLARCEVRLAKDKAATRAARWWRIVREAAKQCDRVPPPEAEAPVSLSDFLQAIDGHDLKIVAWLGDGRRKIGEVLREAAEDAAGNPLRAALLLGPEGDLTPEEVEAACAAGFIPVDLGPRVLRADTAPIALVTMLQHVLGDMR